MIYHFPAIIYLFKVNNGNTIDIGNHFGIFTTKSGTDFAHCSAVSIIDFERVNASWVEITIQILRRKNSCSEILLNSPATYTKA